MSRSCQLVLSGLMILCSTIQDPFPIFVCFSIFYLLIILPIIQALDRLGHVDEVINDPEYAFSLNLCSLVFLRMDMNISLLLASA